MMKKLMFGLTIAFAATAEAETISRVKIGELTYNLDTETKAATICGYDKDNPPTTRRWASPRSTEGYASAWRR